MTDIQETDSTTEQGKVLTEALDIFIERNPRRGDLWAQFGASDSLFHVTSKLARAKAARDKIVQLLDLRQSEEVTKMIEECEAEIIDSCLDMANFAVFTVRHVRAGRLG